MKLFIITLSALILTPAIMLGQFWDRQFQSDLLQMDEYIKRNDRDIDFTDTESYSGTPYNNPSYLPGTVYKGDEVYVSDVALRYNAVADEMEIKKTIAASDEDARVLTKSPDIFVKILDDIFVFVPYQGGVEDGGYFQVLFEGQNLDLYKKHIKDFTPAKPATTSITRPVPAKFDDEPVYYLVDKQGKFYELPSNQNRMMKVFGENRNMMKDYAKENSIDIRKEDHLKRLIMYYDRESNGIE
jgi:hypothetical protein